MAPFSLLLLYGISEYFTQYSTFKIQYFWTYSIPYWILYYLMRSNWLEIVRARYETIMKFMVILGPFDFHQFVRIKYKSNRDWIRSKILHLKREVRSVRSVNWRRPCPLCKLSSCAPAGRFLCTKLFEACAVHPRATTLL